MDVLALLGVVLLAGLVGMGLWSRASLQRNLAGGASAPGRLEPRTFLRPYRAPLAVAAALTVVGTVLDLAAPWPLKVAVDHIIGAEPLTGWLAPLAAFSTAWQAAFAALAGVALIAASGVVGYLAAYLIGGAAERLGADLRSAAFGCLQRRSLLFHDRHRTGDLVSRLTSDVSRVQDAFVSWFETLLPELLALLGMLIVLFMLDVPMALAALAVTPILAVQMVWSRAHMKRAARDVRERHGRLASRATEVLRNVRAVQAFLRHDDEERRFRSESAAVTRSALTALDLEARYAPTSDLILSAGSGLVLFLGILRVSTGDMTLGTLFVILSYLSGLYHPLRALTRLTAVLARGSASRERLMEIFAENGRIPEDPGAIPAPQAACEIVLRNVSFAYRRATPVLRHVSFAVRAGETVCIVGSTGAGKSTLLALLLRLYDPDEGSITMHGIDIRRCGIRSLRERVALVPQDPWILDGTLADSIRYGRSDATDEELRAAARLALVDEFVGRLPHGYDTVVGESGARLSGGQRRRVALARALVRNAPLLLLDEPTSGLDAASETMVVDALRTVAQHRTVVMVTHRLRLASIAGRVLVLDGGRLVEDGDPAVLLAAGGHFARLWAHQGLPVWNPEPESEFRRAGGEHA
jgi:ATP-binding cassette subfamily B protein